MEQYRKFVGLDVHKSSIAIAVAEQGREPARFLGKIPHDLTRVLRKLRRLGPAATIQVCFEAGPTGYGLQRRLLEQGYDCKVVAASKTPRGAADRVKTDRRDAERLAHFLRSGDLVFIRVPTPGEESMRNLLRAREDARNARHKARQQLNMFLLRSGRTWEGRSRWIRGHMLWIGSQKFHDEADTRVTQEAHQMLGSGKATQVSGLDCDPSRHEQLDAAEGLYRLGVSLETQGRRLPPA